jgi:hypothetical protein
MLEEISMSPPSKQFPTNVAFLALLAGFLLSDMLAIWMVVPVARGLGFFLAVVAFFPVVRRHHITFQRVLIMALSAGLIAGTWSLLLMLFRLK